MKDPTKHKPLRFQWLTTRNIQSRWRAGLKNPLRIAHIAQHRRNDISVVLRALAYIASSLSRAFAKTETELNSRIRRSAGVSYQLTTKAKQNVRATILSKPRTATATGSPPEPEPPSVEWSLLRGRGCTSPAAAFDSGMRLFLWRHERSRTTRRPVCVFSFIFARCPAANGRPMTRDGGRTSSPAVPHSPISERWGSNGDFSLREREANCAILFRARP